MISPEDQSEVGGQFRLGLGARRGECFWGPDLVTAAPSRLRGQDFAEGEVCVTGARPPHHLVGAQLGFSTVDSPRLTFSPVYPERPRRVSCLSGSTPTRFPAHAPLLRSLWSRQPLCHLSVSLLPLTFLHVHLFLPVGLFPAPSGAPPPHLGRPLCPSQPFCLWPAGG